MFNEILDQFSFYIAEEILVSFEMVNVWNIPCSRQIRNIYFPVEQVPTNYISGKTALLSILVTIQNDVLQPVHIKSQIIYRSRIFKFHSSVTT